MTSSIALSIYQGLAGDRNERGILGASLVGHALSERFELTPKLIGVTRAPIDAGWDIELEAARKDLCALSTFIEQSLTLGHRPLTAMGRCASALATLPVIAKHRPDAKIVWFDAHADANTPQTTTTEYLGGMVLTGAAGLWDSGLGADLDLSRVVLVGARDIDPAERALIDAGRLKLVSVADDFALQLRQALAGSAVYIHLDCDVLEPGIVSTEFRVPGGLTIAQLRSAFDVLTESEVIGLEIAEFESYEPDGTIMATPDALLDALESVIRAMLKTSSC
jgi:arginase